ncbi:hypothetical protein AvCA_04820 [Azotobacter vinelandii CA]|uniref:Uncharacterized protein n=2 Tax=Azotobacter vinelandii TaxID=354 RepID=C1DJF1_AZOVD|nr:DUF2388 domain-containing protein [Azotobacter vinelandii]ACO76736.1 conserved hypothetical protein [Azotobacter vinelandii DJ]AGK17285.1 hypothetical protein AvCA_04820 [Azotobacter vinelandii CA]AGK19328.1 hypothetical protein AvCA6_04820 [Azotobacter vinelandii CA6]WKN22495.1 DUF2388 domain-containing protein [Azotobacter vinelandii]SFX81077.1 conserverd hypothetical protein [Azotobacter vinelandii]
MNSKIAVLAIGLTALPFGAAQADDDFVRDIISSGITTASTYLTVKDDKLIVAAREDAGTFVASDGRIRGPYLEAALRQLREADPRLQASDMELAGAILAGQPEAPVHFDAR